MLTRWISDVYNCSSSSLASSELHSARPTSWRHSGGGGRPFPIQGTGLTYRGFKANNQLTASLITGMGLVADRQPTIRPDLYSDEM